MLLVSLIHSLRANSLVMIMVRFVTKLEVDLFLNCCKIVIFDAFRYVLSQNRTPTEHEVLTDDTWLEWEAVQLRVNIGCPSEILYDLKKFYPCLTLSSHQSLLPTVYIMKLGSSERVKMGII